MSGIMSCMSTSRISNNTRKDPTVPLLIAITTVSLSESPKKKGYYNTHKFSSVDMDMQRKFSS